MKKLLLCAGPRSGPFGNESDWFRVDMSPEGEPDMIADIRDKAALTELWRRGPWNQIALIHGIEHFYVWEAFELLKTLREMLADDGELILEQPNLEQCCLHFDNPIYRRGIYGSPEHSDPALAHHYGYTPSMLIAMARKTGFTRTAVLDPVFHHPERDFRLVARP